MINNFQAHTANWANNVKAGALSLGELRRNSRRTVNLLDVLNSNGQTNLERYVLPGFYAEQKRKYVRKAGYPSVKVISQRKGSTREKR
jgi:hypothetical protein